MDEAERIDRILLEWREAMDRGEPVAPDEVVRLHPDLEKPLRARFQALAVFDAVFGEPAPPVEHLRILPADRYSDFELAGRGGMGIVFSTRDTDLHRRIAYKTVRPEGDGSPSDDPPADPSTLAPPTPGTVESKAYESLRARFLQEAWVTAGLEHPGIVPVYELGENAEGVPYYTMRFVGGRRTLETAIDEAVDLEARFDLLEPFLKVCDTIRYAHSRGVVHRDLKPDHIALGEFGEVVVLDWGLAKVRGRPDFGRDLLRERIEKYRDAADLRTAANALGTPGYMAPEAARGRTEQVDEKADIFSLGAILYRILTRRLPYPAGHFEDLENSGPGDEDPVRASEVETGVPEELSRICALALAVDRDRRYDDVDRLARALRDWRRERTIESEVTGLLREASVAMADPDALPLAQLDRVSALCARALHLRPEHPEATDLARRAERARALAIQARERAVRTRLIQRVALPVFLLAVIASMTAWFLYVGRREAIDAERRISAALKSARSLALAQSSEMVATDDPMLSLLLAREAGRSAPLSSVVSRLHEAIAGSRERTVLRGHGDRVNTAVISPRGDRILTASDDETARLWELDGVPGPLLRGHEDRVRAAAFSADGTHIVTASDDMRVRLYTAGGGDPIATYEGHEDYVVEARFSNSGERILTVSWDRTARLWSLESGLIASFREPAGVPAAAFFPDGRRVVTASRSGVAHVWGDDGKQLATLSGHTETLTDVAVSPDGDRVLTVARDGTVRLWTPTGEAVAVLTAHEAGVNRAVFSPNGRRFVTGAEDGLAILWSSEGGLLARLAGHDQRVNGIAFSPAGDRIAVAADDGRISLWSGSGVHLATLGAHSAEVLSVAFDRRGEHIVSASADGTARLWATEAVESALFRGHGDEVESAAFSPDGREVLTASDDGTARLWHSDGRPIAVLSGHESYLTVATFAPDGDAALTAAWDGTAILWKRDAEQAWRPTNLTGHRAGIWAAIFSPDGHWILTASEDRTARLWNLEGELRATLTHEGSVVAAAFSPDSKTIVTASNRTGRLWKLDGTASGELTGHEGRVVSVSYSPDGALIATASWDRTARLWSADATPRASLEGHGAEVEDSIFSPAGDLVLTASSDGVARIFDLTGTLRASLAGHPRGIAAARFSPDGRFVVTAAGRIFGSPDSSARLWRVDGTEVAVLAGHASRVSSVEFSPDGRRILTASADGTARTWLVEVDDLLRLADERVTRDLTPEERRRHVSVMEPEAE